MKNNSKKTGNILITAGVIMIASALVIMCYNIICQRKAAELSGNMLSQIKIPDAPEGSTPDYILCPGIDMPEIEIDGEYCIAIIEIPQADIKLPVISECTKAKLKVAPCRYYGSVYTDNMVIAGHNYRTHFRNLANLKQGDEVILTDMDGNRFEYEVSATDILRPVDVEDMINEDWPLTLFTCDYSNQNRVTIRCDYKK